MTETGAQHFRWPQRPEMATNLCLIGDDCQSHYGYRVCPAISNVSPIRGHVHAIQTRGDTRKRTCVPKRAATS